MHEANQGGEKWQSNPPSECFFPSRHLALLRSISAVGESPNMFVVMSGNAPFGLEVRQLSGLAL
jgi:hypothetical protein